MERTAKVCPVCKLIKKDLDYHTDNKRSDRLAWACKECARERRKEHYRNNKEKTLLINEKYKRKMPDSVRIKCAESQRNYNKTEKSKILKLQYSRSERGKRKHSFYLKQRMKIPKWHLNSNFLSSIYQSIKGNRNGRRWEFLVDYTLTDLQGHLEKQFKEGMTWDNYGEWQIDHIIPVSAFNFTKPEHIDFKRCWALKNLQPMWAKENQKKYNKINGMFQPTLQLVI